MMDIHIGVDNKLTVLRLWASLKIDIFLFIILVTCVNFKLSLTRCVEAEIYSKSTNMFFKEKEMQSGQFQTKLAEWVICLALDAQDPKTEYSFVQRGSQSMNL
jgi:hypothetical protein